MITLELNEQETLDLIQALIIATKELDVPRTVEMADRLEKLTDKVRELKAKQD